MDTLLGKTIGGYLLEEELGRGGMGVVFRARARDGRQVALKVLNQKSQAGATERFRREGDMLAKLGSHPHVVKIHAAGEEGGLLYLVMELVDGGSLERKLPLEPLEAARIVEEVARAVDHLHQHGIVHRDIKPGNVLVGRDGRTRLTDFGLARDLARATRLTGAGQIVGTPYYMAPETLRASQSGEEPGPLADVYALGALLYAAVTGRPPYEARTFAELVALIQTSPVPHASAENDACPPELDAIATKAMAREPEDRYESALALADDLGRLLRGDSVEARAPSAVSRLTRRIRKNPRTAIALGVGAVVSLAFPFVARAVVGWNEARLERDKRRSEAERFAKRIEIALSSAQSERHAAERALSSEPERARDRARIALESLDLIGPAPFDARALAARIQVERALDLLVEADALRALGEDAAALARYRQSASLAPPPAKLLAHLAEALASAGELDEARLALAGLRDDDDVRRARGIVALARGELEQAVNALEPIGRTTRDPIATLALAEAHAARGHPDEALRLLDLGSFDARSPEPGRIRARALAQLGQERESDIELERAIKLSPGKAAIALEHARLLLARGEALRAASLVSSFDKKAPEVALVLAASRAITGAADPEGPLDDALASASGPRDALARALLLRAALARARRDLGAAATFATRALESSPEELRGRASLELARALLDRGDARTPIEPSLVARGEAALGVASADPATRLEAMIELARSKLARGEVPALDALEPWEKDSPEVLELKAEIARAAGDSRALEEAHAQVRQAREPTPGALPPRERLRGPLAFLVEPLESAAATALAAIERANVPDLALVHSSELQAALAFAIAPDARRAALLSRARLVAGDGLAAVELARQATARDPGAPGAAIAHARASLATGQGLELALEALGAVLAPSLQGASPLGLNDLLRLEALRARVLVRLGRGSEAESELARAAIARPVDARLALALACVARSIGDAKVEGEMMARFERDAAARDLAIRDYDGAVERGVATQARDLLRRRIALDPDFGPAYRWRSSYMLGQDSNVVIAFVDFAHYLALDGDDAQELLDWQSDFARANQVTPAGIRRALAAFVEPTDQAVRMYAAGLAEVIADQTGLDSSRLEDAVRAFDRVLELAPASRCVFVLRGRARWRLGRFESGKSDLTAAIKSHDAPLLAHFFNACVQAHEGHALEAVNELNLCGAAQGSLVTMADADPDLGTLAASVDYQRWRAAVLSQGTKKK